MYPVRRIALLLSALGLGLAPLLAGAATAAHSGANVSVTLHWSAPGNDGTVGRASRYDVRYSATRITAETFAQATPIMGVPAPADAGAQETFTVTGLPAGVLYFAIKTANAAGNWSDLSNIASPLQRATGEPVAVAAAFGSSDFGAERSAMLDVPVVQQEPEHCGQAALEMVLRYWGAGDIAVAECARAYDPALRGSLVTDLAAAARRAGYDAEVREIDADSLVALVRAGVPPIVLYQNGRLLTVRHFAVVTGWDPARGVFTLHDGTAVPRSIASDDLARRWKTAGSQALVVRRREP